jgi:hypothetical protein
MTWYLVKHRDKIICTLISFVAEKRVERDIREPEHVTDLLFHVVKVCYFSTQYVASFIYYMQWCVKFSMNVI